MPAYGERARLLYQQRRFLLAANELRREIAEEPDSADPHALLAMCLIELDDQKQALREAAESIRLSPDDAFGHYARAFVLARMNEFHDAETAIGEALRLDTENVNYYQLLARIRLGQANWKGALVAADRGLEIQSDNVGCTNARAQALIKMGRRDEALQTVDSALRFEPDNARSHANKGWTLLEAKDPNAALEHFREALRLDPNLAWARQGMLLALKARYPVYRVVLSYFLWMARLPKKTRYAVIGGLWLLNMLRGTAQDNHLLAKFLAPIGGIYLLFCFVTWTADPLFNAVLRFNSYGKYLLTKNQIVASNYVGGAFATGILSLLVWLLRRHDGWLVLGFGGIALTYFSAMAMKAPSRVGGIVTRTLLAVSALILLVCAIVLGL